MYVDVKWRVMLFDALMWRGTLIPSALRDHDDVPLECVMHYDPCHRWLTRDVKYYTMSGWMTFSSRSVMR